MGYQKDLDWLARYMHEWPFGIQSYIYVITEDNGSKTWCGNVHYCAKRHRRVDKGEWLARRAELQAKAEPQSFTGLDEAIRKVLSEMRDLCVAALEKMTDMHNNHEEIDMSSERVQKNAESVHDWHERGELPPVGTVCEVLWNEGRMEYLRTKVFGVNEHGQPIHRFDEGPKKFQYQADPLVTILGTRVFRPIRTERDELIEIICSEYFDKDIDGGSLADAILAAGFRREGGSHEQ